MKLQNQRWESRKGFLVGRERCLLLLHRTQIWFPVLASFWTHLYGSQRPATSCPLLASGTRCACARAHTHVLIYIYVLIYIHMFSYICICILKTCPTLAQAPHCVLESYLASLRLGYCLLKLVFFMYLQLLHNAFMLHICAKRAETIYYWLRAEKGVLGALLTTLGSQTWLNGIHH